MMEIAAEWLKVNPDPGSGFINVPGLEKSKERRTAIVRDRQVTELQKKAKLAGPEFQKMYEGLLGDLDTQLAALHEMNEIVIDKETELEALLNEVPTPSQSKDPTDASLRTDLGRWSLAWARQGHNVFDLSPDFAAAMLLTDPTEVDIKTVRLPFKGMLITIPSGFSTGVEGLHYTKIHAWEMPRTHIDQLDVGNQIVGALKGLSLDSKRSILSNVEESLAKQPPRLLTPRIDESDTCVCIYATDGVHAFNTLIESKDLSWEAIDALPDSVTDEADRQARRTIQQIVFGMLAYVNAVAGAVTERATPEKSKKKKRKSGERLKHWEVGRTIKLDHNLVQAARSGSREIALRIKTRFIVRGHYRNQAHGPKRSERTMRWIAPFWKGPEEGARIVHTYKLEGEKTESP